MKIYEVELVSSEEIKIRNRDGTEIYPFNPDTGYIIMSWDDFAEYDVEEVREIKSHVKVKGIFPSDNLERVDL